MLLVDINLAAAEKTLALVQERFPNVKAAAIEADVGKEADVKAAVDKAVELFGRLDVMVRVYLFSLLLPYPPTLSPVGSPRAPSSHPGGARTLECIAR